MTDGFDRAAARARLAEELPAALVPLLAVVDELPTRTSGKVDRAALPWPLPGVEPDAAGLGASAAWLAEQWQAVLGVPVSEPDASFFDLGGGSLAAAQLVSRIRARDPEFTVADIYDHPRLGSMADELEARAPEPGSAASTFRQPIPTPRGTQWVQTLVGVPLFILSGARWLLYLLTATTILDAVSDGFGFLPTVPLWVLLVGLAIFATPFGRMAIAIAGARILLAGLEPGDYPRGGAVHLRMWLADQIAHQVDAVGLAGAPWVSNYARALGARIGEDVDLHTLPPVTGMLTIGDRAAIEPEVDLAGTWIDGDVVRIGRVRIGAGSTIGARSTLLPGARIGKGAEIAPGSAVFGRVPARPALGGIAGRADRPRRSRHRRAAPAHALAHRVRRLVAPPLAAADRGLRRGRRGGRRGHGRRRARSARPRCARSRGWSRPRSSPASSSPGSS